MNFQTSPIIVDLRTTTTTATANATTNNNNNNNDDNNSETSSNASNSSLLLGRDPETGLELGGAGAGGNGASSQGRASNGQIVQYGDSMESVMAGAGGSPSDRRDISDSAIWTLSSCKTGFGVDQLRDDNTETFWQSDGPQPHSVNIQFVRKTLVKELALYLDYKQDESYTPSKISVRAGTHFHDLQEVLSLTLEDPCGWVLIPLEDQVQDSSNSRSMTSGSGILTHLIQVAVLLNHQNGRDSHIRQIKLFTSRRRRRRIQSESSHHPTYYKQASGKSDNLKDNEGDGDEGDDDDGNDEHLSTLEYKNYAYLR